MKNLFALLLFGVIIGSVLVLGPVLIRTGLSLLSPEEPWGCPKLSTLSSAARAYGGSKDDWHKSGATSFTYDGTKKLQFRIPDGCVMEVSGSYYRAGQSFTFHRGDRISNP